MDAALTTVETNQLAECEAVIERGLNTFVEVGQALLAIRDARLYRLTHGTFEDYCRERWGMERNYANKLVAAASVMEDLGTVVPILPANESQARPLTALDTPEERQTAWQRAVETAPEGKVTGRHVQAVVDEMRGISHDDAPADTDEPWQAPPETWDEKPDATPAKMAVHYSSETPEWYTPPEIVERVVRVMGSIDLDPCADPGKTIPAALHYTAEDNGRAYRWTGRVYMNPPYGDEIEAWVWTLKDSYNRQDASEAIALLPARTDTQWMDLLAEYPRCYIRGRLKFSGHTNSAPFPSMVVYLGFNVERFAQVFGEIGRVYVLWSAENDDLPF